MDELMADFLTETQESLGELDTALVRLERNPQDRDTLSLIFRLVHTIKGTCGFLGLPRLERVAHAAENVLGSIRDGELAVSNQAITLVLAALDRVKVIVAGLAATGAEPAGEDAELIAGLDALQSGADPTPPKQAMPPAIEEAPAPSEAGTQGQTIRVAVDVLEDLMTLVSELVLARNQLLQLSRSHESAVYAAPLQRLSQITSDLQEGVMKTRMQPIGSAWAKLPRLVRDLGHDLGKRIELHMRGAETELDRQVLELIRDPLTHMVRNSADHGLEAPAERRDAGKPDTGRIMLNAFHEGGHIIIEIADDGRGLPVERIRAKALSRGLASEAELAAMDDAQVQRFIFHPGFSTAAEVTAVSGRGVGMDVVKTNIEKIGGTIGLRSIPGRGTTFTIKIPLTLAIVAALIVQAGGERFAIPQISVVELVRAGASGAAIERLDATPVLRLRDRLLPLVSLNDLLRLDATAQADAASTIVVAQVGGRTLGIIVDRVFDTEEIVVKPVSPILRHMTMFSGNTILGDGSVIMILDPHGIARAVGIGAEEQQQAAAQDMAEEHSAERSAMLLFRAGGAEPLAVPLGLVARIEEVAGTAIERTDGQWVMQYRGRLMPLIGLSAEAAPPAGEATRPVLVFTEGARSMGLLVDEILDVVEERLHVELSGRRAGLLGTAVIAGRATGVLDTGHFLTRAWQDWFGGAGQTVASARPRLLVVEDSGFFRQLLVPALSASGYDVVAVADAARALALREAGRRFDAIVSDIEMPDLDGLEFARRVREGGAWAALPLIALSGRAAAADEAAGREAGFTDYVRKFDRDALLASLQQCLAEPATA
jgi:two-component system chemotaxis sensor kinase CheA